MANESMPVMPGTHMKVKEHEDGTFSYVIEASDTPDRSTVDSARMALNRLHGYVTGLLPSLEHEAPHELDRAHHELTRSRKVRIRVYKDRTGKTVRVEVEK